MVQMDETLSVTEREGARWGADTQTQARMNEWINERTNERTNERMRKINGWRKEGMYMYIEISPFIAILTDCAPKTGQCPVLW